MTSEPGGVSLVEEACCRERRDLPKDRNVPCMNTKPDNPRVLCSRLAGHDGEHTSCRSAPVEQKVCNVDHDGEACSCSEEELGTSIELVHRADSWPRKDGDWSGSNLPRKESSE